MRVDVNPTQLNNYGLGLEDVRTMLASANANRPKGEFRRQRRELVDWHHRSALKAGNTIRWWSAYNNGARSSFRDVANVTDSVEDMRTAGNRQRQAGHPADHFPTARRQHHRHGRPRARPDAATEAAIPAAINLYVMLDRTTTIRASVHDVQSR